MLATITVRKVKKSRLFGVGDLREGKWNILRISCRLSGVTQQMLYTTRNKANKIARLIRKQKPVRA